MKRLQRQDELKQWLTMNEVQVLLDYASRNPIYGFCKKYGVRTTKPRGRRYFHRADLLEALDNNSACMGV